jgi:prepilin-type N-terminal cleavage/methylation domain-containing protein
MKCKTTRRLKMNTKKNKKSGFTLVELMVVAIIVAILAAVAIPLMSGNKGRAAATEAQAGCSTIATAVRMNLVEGDAFETTINNLPGINDGDLDGNYFDHTGYSIAGAYSNYTITATANGNEGISGDVTMQNIANDITWGGTLLD